MKRPKQWDNRQYGDFQTPLELAFLVCSALVRRGIAPKAVLEPTCGCGSFLVAASQYFPESEPILGVEINPAYVDEARRQLGPSSRVEVGDFFTFDWETALPSETGPWLMLGNPPWVTNAELGVLGSTNLPRKSNFQNHKGLDALTGKSNFDISEWMLLKQLGWLRSRSGWLAVLVKTSVARKVLRQAWQRREPVGRAAIYKINALQHFGAAVDACLFVLPVSIGAQSQECDLYYEIGSDTPQSTIGLQDGFLVSNVELYTKHRALVGHNDHYYWRSGVKHDCSKVMELTQGDVALFCNGMGEQVDLEADFIFPLLKSSDIAKGRTRSDRFMLITQREIGEETSIISHVAPKTWRYLLDHSAFLDARGSIIYRGKPRFSIFGVGSYSFSPWKVAVSGFYKSINFTKIAPIGGKPVMLDDTIYFLPCYSEEEADFLLHVLKSAPFKDLLSAMIFLDDKRPVTADILKRISLRRVANSLGLADTYDGFTQMEGNRQHELALS